MPKRFAFISTMESYTWGGSEELWSATAAVLLSQGHAVHANVKGWRDESPHLTELQRGGCQIHRRWGPRRGGGPLGRALGQAVWNYRYRTEWDRWFAQARPDLVVISQGSNADGIDWALACAQRQIPFALIAHAASEHHWPEDSKIERIQSAMAAARTCFFVAHANAALTSRQIGSPIARARVIRNPYKVSYDASPPWPGDGEELNLACVARLEIGPKGQDLLFETLSAEKWKRRPVRVTIFGKGPNEAVLRRLADAYQLANVTFGGFVADIERVWAEHHALILPSRMEGLPLAVVEAMLCGRPCIVTKVAGNAELIEDNVSGFVAAAPTVPLIDEAMERAWNRRNDLREMGHRAALDARKHIPPNPAVEFAQMLLELTAPQRTAVPAPTAADLRGLAMATTQEWRS